MCRHRPCGGGLRAVLALALLLALFSASAPIACADESATPPAVDPGVPDPASPPAVATPPAADGGGEEQPEKPKKYTVRFSSGDNALDRKSKKVTVGRKYGKLAVTKKKGYRFVGWFTKRVGGKRITADSVVKLKKSITLYARWEKTSKGVDRSVKGLPVLMYHQFYDASKGEGPKPGLEANWMTAAKFRSHMRYLKKEGYYFPSWDEVYAFLKGRIDLPKKSVVVTIDDGQKSFYVYAAAALKKYKIRGTGFVITRNLKKKTVKKYQGAYVSLQSHTDRLHVRGGSGRGIALGLPLGRIKADLNTSVKLLGKKDAIAYPFGHYNGTLKRAVKEVGFRMAFTTVPGRVYPGMDRLELPRVRVNAGVSMETFQGLVR
jgi:uncharacterized repeat protein (TIGR02543 family)